MAGAQIHGGQVVAHLVGLIAALSGVALAELTIVVAAPALHRAVIQERAGVVLAEGGHRGGVASAERDGGQAVAELVGVIAEVGGVALAELAIAVVAPALQAAVIEGGAGGGRVGLHRGDGAAGAEIQIGEGAVHLRLLSAPVVGVLLAELAVIVTAPTLHSAVVQHRAGVILRRVEAGGGVAGAQIHGGQVVAHLVGLIAALSGVALAELTIVVAAPALHRAVIQERAGVVLAEGGHRGGVASAERDGGQAVAELVGVIAEVGGVALAELAIAVVAPALQAAVIEHRAVGVTPHGDLSDRAAGAELHVLQGAVHLRGLGASVVGVALAELAVAVVAPALQLAGLEHRAVVVGEAVELGGGVAGAEIDGGEGPTHLVGVVTALGGVALAELTIVVAAPALHQAAVEQGAGVLRRRAHLSHGEGLAESIGAEVHRVEIVAHLSSVIAEVGGVALAEVAIAVVAPALEAAVVEHGAGVVRPARHLDDEAAGAEIYVLQGAVHLR